MLTESRVVLLTDQDNPELPYDAILKTTADVETMRSVLRDQLARHVITHSPELLGCLFPLLDVDMVSSALAAANLRGRIDLNEDAAFGISELRDDELENGLIKELGRLPFPPIRQRFAPGEGIIREGDDSGGIWVILEGSVELFRTVDGDELVFHAESAGRIIGLMALYRQSPVFFSCRAKEQVIALYLSHEDLRRALHASPEFGSSLIGVILRSLARRNHRSAELLLSVRALNHQLAEQRDALESALTNLRDAQERLIESEKMSTLGTLAAGMAHELNNPVSAILRAAEFLESDVKFLLAATPDLTIASAALPLAMARPPLSTADERAIKSTLTEALQGDRSLAARLYTAGVHNAEELGRLLAKDDKRPRDEAILQIERGGQIGSALRNLGTCSRRISSIVRSLKIYARNDQQWQVGVDIHQTMDDILTLLANHLRDIDLHKDFGKLPPITCIPSQLEQVWTNLILNAIQAMDGKGVIRIHTECLTNDRLVITIEDHGPGIPTELQPRIFESRFTTRSGRVEFGLGLGLPISKTLIANHGGRISFTSQPGLTRFVVELPLKPNTES